MSTDNSDREMPDEGWLSFARNPAYVYTASGHLTEDEGPAFRLIGSLPAPPNGWRWELSATTFADVDKDDFERNRLTAMIDWKLIKVVDDGIRIGGESV